MNDSLWHHVAAVYDPAAAKTVSLYVDGVLDTANNLTVNVNTGTTNNFTIGRRIDGVNNFDGDIDEVRVWDVALTPAQILNNMNSEFCVIPTGLKAYFKLNQGVASSNNSTVTTAFNSINSAQNGTLNNFALINDTSNWVLGAPVTSLNTYDTITRSACSMISPSGNYTYTTTGVYQDTLTNQYNCDSLITINFTAVNTPVFVNLTLAACDSLVSPSGKYIWTTSGTYIDTIPSSKGCDSIMAITATVNSVSVNVNQNANVLTAAQTNATYQWLDCNNGYAMIAGETAKTFTATANGSYAVRVSLNGCIDTSACYQITSVGLNHYNLERAISSMPNPTSGLFKIQLANEYKANRLIVRNILGELIIDKILNAEKNIELNINSDNGIYFVEIQTTNGERTTLKVIKQ